MDGRAIVEQYLKITKRFSYLAGTWPYQKTSSKVPIMVATFIVAALAMATQVAYAVRIHTLDVVFEQYPFIAVAAGLVGKQVYCGIIYEPEFKSLLNGMYNDWTMKRCKEEIDIMNMYAKRATKFIMFYAVAALSSTIFFVNMPYMSSVMDILLPLNESREPRFPYQADYPFDEDKYFYVITNHRAALIIMILFVFTAVDTMFIYLVQHACGLLAISGYRFHYSVDNAAFICKEKEIVDSAEEIYKKVCNSIQAHERAVAYLKDIQNTYMTFFFIFMTLVTIAFSVSLLKMSSLEMKMNADYSFYCIFLFVQLMHIFFMVYQGQFVINAIDSIYNQIYDGLWYNASARTQSLFVLALRRALTSPQITAGGLVTFSLESFSTMMKTSFSYFTVLKSM